MALDDRDYMKARARKRLKGMEEIPSHPPLKGMPPKKSHGPSLWTHSPRHSTNRTTSATHHTRAPGDDLYRGKQKPGRHPVETLCWGLLTIATLSAILVIALAVLPGFMLPDSMPEGWNPLLLIESLNWSTPRGIAQNAAWLGVFAFLLVGVVKGRWSPLTFTGWLVLCLVLAGIPV